MSQRVHVTRAAEVLKSSGGHIFSVTFRKRTNGEIRKMVARFGVAKNLKGTGQRFSTAEKGLLTVFDMEKHAYRMINLPDLISARINGQDYTFTSTTK